MRNNEMISLVMGRVFHEKCSSLTNEWAPNSIETHSISSPSTHESKLIESADFVWIFHKGDYRFGHSRPSERIHEYHTTAIVLGERLRTTLNVKWGMLNKQKRMIKYSNISRNFNSILGYFY